MFTSAENSKPQEKGFTLIELLVVIAIMAILAAILFPVFQGAGKGPPSLLLLKREAAWTGLAAIRSG